MKPPPFRYKRADSLDEALGLLADHGDEAKVLAGGQSLLPLLNMRLLEPAVLVDIGRIGDLQVLDAGADHLTIGAGVTHRRLERLPGSEVLVKLVRTAAAHIGHQPIRERGTFGGSLAHADPAAEWCLLAALADAELELASARGNRVVPAPEFLIGFLTTALAPDELLVAVRLPHFPAGNSVGFSEYCRRAGDFATALAATAIQITDGHIAAARVALGGGLDLPRRIPEAEAVLLGAAASNEATIHAATHVAADALECHPRHGIDSRTLRRIARVCLNRAIDQALATSTTSHLPRGRR